MAPALASLIAVVVGCGGATRGDGAAAAELESGPVVVRATRDEQLRATVTARRPLLYAAGADPAEDRPGHVRAASAGAFVGGRLAVVQDDAGFVALLRPDGACDAIALPRGEGGARQFDDIRGNKAFKLDLEAAVATTIDGAAVLVAFGSGSTPARERLLVLRGAEARIAEAPALYAALRARADFAGSELNIEGAALVGGGQLRLFQRGNGAPAAGVPAVDATGDLPFEALLHHAERGGPAPALANVTRYELGEIGGVRLTFTDAAATPGEAVLYLAGAEASPDAVRDGPVSGSAIGVIDARGARWAAITDAAGALLVVKAEGIVLDPDDPDHAVVLVDTDDPTVPAELLDIQLSGPWLAP